MLKAAIVLLLLATLVSLFSGLFFLVKDEGRTSRVVNALTVRVSLTALTVALIAWGFYTGQLVSHVTWQVSLQHIHEDKQANPHHIDKVPIPGSRLETEVLLRAEMATDYPNQHNAQHQRTQGYVGTVKAGEHKEGRAIDARAQGQAQFGVGVDVLLDLQHQKGDAENHRQRQPQGQRLTVVLA